MKKFSIFFLYLVLLLCVSIIYFSIMAQTADADSQIVHNGIVHNPRLYGYIYWENGFPTLTARRPPSWHNAHSQANPDLIIQTGYYNWRFDADNIALPGYDASSGSDYLSALHEDVTTFSAANLLLVVYKNGVPYTASSGTIDTDDLQVRLIESGQYVQRFDHLGITFTDSGGNELDIDGYFEVTAWPDRVVYTLDFSDSTDVTRTTVAVTSPDGVTHLQDQLTNKIHLAIQPQDNERLALLDPADYVTEAYEKDTNDAVAVAFDEDQYALRLDLEPARVHYPAAIGRIDEYVFTVNNPNDEETNIPLVFNQIRPPKITGTVMNLVEDDDGRPTGIPVQISKNWHRKADAPTKHEGSWLRGSSMITLPANSSKTLRLRVVYGYWDEAGAVSHSQLSLIGWGGNWKWDESALGAWGETMTFDPAQHIGSAFMDDIRPTWTPPMNAPTTTTHNWTENVGGGDFLKYFDENGNYRWAKKLKTAYRWTGPNITEILYSGISDDEKVRFTYTTQLVRTNDYNRRFQKYRYEILEDITNPTRFVYYQMAADFYMVPVFDNYYIGNSSGEVTSKTATHGGNAYTGESFTLNDSWLAIDDTMGGGGVANGVRGILWQETTLNGEPQTLYVHPYGRTWGSSTTLFDMSASTVRQSYSAGDVIEGQLEFALPAKSQDVYWGDDSEFAQRLTNHAGQWGAVQDEYNYNNQMTVEVSQGTLVNHYPIVVDAQLDSGSVRAQFTIPANQGIGYIPIILQNAPAGLALRAQILVNGAWQQAVNDAANVENNAFYQGYLNADGTMDYAFNVIRPVGTLDSDLTIRLVDFPEILQTEITLQAMTSQTPSTLSLILTLTLLLACMTLRYCIKN